MEKKEILEKISVNCKLVKWLEKVEMKAIIKKEIEYDLKRKGKSYDKMMNIGEKRMKAEEYLDAENLERNRKFGKSLV